MHRYRQRVILRCTHSSLFCISLFRTDDMRNKLWNMMITLDKKKYKRQTIFIAYFQLNIRSERFALTMSEINLSCSFIFLYRPSSNPSSISARYGFTRIPIKRGCLSFPGNAVNSRHNARTFDCGHEKRRRSQAKEGWRNSRTSATRCRRKDEARGWGGKGKRTKKERKKRKKERRVRRSGSRRIKRSPRAFQPRRYILVTDLHAQRAMMFKGAKCIWVSLFLSTRGLRTEFFNYTIRRETRKEVT